MDLHSPWVFLVAGYVATVALETPVLLAGLSGRHAVATRFLAAAWLTACTYPVVVLVLPPLLRESLGDKGYLLVAETFAPGAECLLFAWAFLGKGDRLTRQTAWDFGVITLANLFSFLAGQGFWWWTGAVLAG